MKVINLISGPRNISTALMYSFAQRDDFVVLDEPFYGYYLANSRERSVHPSEEEVLQSMSLSYPDIVESINKKAAESAVFVKGMAHHLLMDDPGFLLEWQNVFLIRKPEGLITSFAKVISHPTIDDIGYKQTLRLLSLLDQAGVPTQVLESDELLKAPETYIKALCRWLNIPFRKNMLSWKPGAIPEDGSWAKHWYASVHASSGFLARPQTTPRVPDHLQGLLEEAKTYYDLIQPRILKNESHATNF